MVIEFLTFDVDPADQPGWIEADASCWTRFLESQPGFVSKQVWVDREQPSHVHTAITWSDEASWQAVAADELARVDESMGDWWRPHRLRTFDVVGVTPPT